MKIDARPFSEYWIFCTMNDILSLVLVDNPSYLDFACMNSYSYYVRGHSCWWRDLSITWEKEYFDFFRPYVTYNKIEATKNDLLEKITARLQNNISVYLTVDTYYAFRNRFDYKREHNIHDFLVTGYDEGSDSLIFLCDTYAGYGENYLPYKDVKKAIVCDNDKIFFKEVIISEDIPEYIMDKDEVKNNANRLRGVLAKLSFQNVWNVDKNKDFTRISNEIFVITKFAERQIANKALFQRMTAHGWISGQLEDELAMETTKIYNLWQNVKAVWIKMSYRYSEKYLDSINRIAKEAIVKEAMIWNKIYDSLQ